jgi:hypothetical protein
MLSVIYLQSIRNHLSFNHFYFHKGSLPLTCTIGVRSPRKQEFENMRKGR